MSDINIGAITEALNDKMDRDGNNIESPRLPIFIVAKQYPTANNNYTWYRKYSDGWVEQGGYSASTGSWGTKTINLPITMANTNYTLTTSGDGSPTDFASSSTATVRGCSRNYVTARTTTSFQCQSNNIVTWEVKGLAAS